MSWLFDWTLINNYKMLAFVDCYQPQNGTSKYKRSRIQTFWKNIFVKHCMIIVIMVNQNILQFLFREYAVFFLCKFLLWNMWKALLKPMNIWSSISFSNLYGSLEKSYKSTSTQSSYSSVRPAAQHLIYIYYNIIRNTWGLEGLQCPASSTNMNWAALSRC